MPCYQVKNLQMKGVVLPWGSVCAVFQDSSEFQKSSISTMSDTYVLVRLLVIVNCMKQSIRSNFALWGEVFDIVHCWCHDNFKHSCKMLALGVIKSKGLYNIYGIYNIWEREGTPRLNATACPLQELESVCRNAWVTKLDAEAWRWWHYY